MDSLTRFLQLTPRADLTIYVQEEPMTLIERTMERGHKRIPNCSYRNTKLFINRAINVFNALVKHSMIWEKLLVVKGGQHIFVAQEHSPQSLLVTMSDNHYAGNNITNTANNTTHYPLF